MGAADGVAAGLGVGGHGSVAACWEGGLCLEHPDAEMEKIYIAVSYNLFSKYCRQSIMAEQETNQEVWSLKSDMPVVLFVIFHSRKVFQAF